MAKYSKPFNIICKKDCKTYRLTLNTSCGLPQRVCDDWKRRSFHLLPGELSNYRSPKSKAAAQAGAFALIEYLKKKHEDGSAKRILTDNITVGAWIEKFTKQLKSICIVRRKQSRILGLRFRKRWGRNRKRGGFRVS